MLAAMIEKKPIGPHEKAKLDVLKKLMMKMHSLIAAHGGQKMEGSPEEEAAESPAEEEAEEVAGIDETESDVEGNPVHETLKSYMRPKKKELPKYALMGSSMKPAQKPKAFGKKA